MQRTKHLGMAVATIAGLATALPSPAHREYEYYGQVGSGFSYGANGLSGTGRADVNLFRVSGMIRF